MSAASMPIGKPTVCTVAVEEGVPSDEKGVFYRSELEGHPY